MKPAIDPAVIAFVVCAASGAVVACGLLALLGLVL